MSINLDKFGNPTNLEDFDDPDVKFENYVSTNHWWKSLYQNRTTRDRAMPYDESLMMVAVLLRQYEMWYQNHETDPTLLHFPYMFRQPKKGDRLVNSATKERYTILEPVKDPITKQWEGVVKLEATYNPPKRTSMHRLEFDNEDKYVRFTSEDPVRLETEDQDDEGNYIDKGPVRPTVVHSLIRRSPGSIGERPFGPSKQYRPRYRESVSPDDAVNQQIEIYGQWFDNLVQFDCWSTDNLSADNLADWFERFMCLYGKVLKKNGVQEVLFMERLRDKAVSKWRQNFQSRQLQYFFRTESLEAKSIREITDIDTTLNLTEEIVDIVGEYQIAGQIVTGQLSAQQYKDLFYNSNGEYLFGNTTINDNQT